MEQKTAEKLVIGYAALFWGFALFLLFFTGFTAYYFVDPSIPSAGALIFVACVLLLCLQIVTGWLLWSHHPFARPISIACSLLNALVMAFFILLYYLVLLVSLSLYELLVFIVPVVPFFLYGLIFLFGIYLFGFNKKIRMAASFPTIKRRQKKA